MLCFHQKSVDTMSDNKNKSKPCIDFSPKGRKFRVNILVDWSCSFCDEDGSFTTHTSENAKDIAVQIIKRCDLIIYMTDIHTEDSSEFDINGTLLPPFLFSFSYFFSIYYIFFFAGGPYPIHNVLDVFIRLFPLLCLSVQQDLCQKRKSVLDKI
jgi:hypothetical protein